MCIMFVYELLNVVSYYNLSVLSMSVIGVPKKSLDERWVGGVTSTEFYFGCLELFYYCNACIEHVCHHVYSNYLPCHSFHLN